MPTIQTKAWDVSVDIATKFRDAVCWGQGYQNTIDGQPNPESKAQFAQRMLNKYAREWGVNLMNSYAEHLKRLEATPITDQDFPE